MATEETDSGLDLTVSETVEGLAESYRQMHIPMGLRPAAVVTLASLA
jgi:hypothetical protein